MQAHNGTLWNPSWKAVEMSQRAVPWSAFILTEHSKTHHGGLSRFAGISTIWGVSKLETLPNPNRSLLMYYSLAGMYRWCQHLTAKLNSFVVFRAFGYSKPCLCSEKFHRSFFQARINDACHRFYEEKLCRLAKKRTFPLFPASTRSGKWSGFFAGSCGSTRLKQHFCETRLGVTVIFQRIW